MEKLIRLAAVLACVLIAGRAAAAPFPANLDASGAGMPVHPVQGFHFQLGVSDGMILSVLTRNGYTDIRITKKKLTKARAEACKKGLKFDVEIGFNGRISRANRIGTCRDRIGGPAARKILREKGFSRIQLVREGAGFVAAACRGNRRFRLTMNQFGDIGREKVLGRCGGSLSEYDIAALLRAQGFSRIDARPARRGSFSVEACRHGDRVTLLVGSDGAILRERRTGACEPPIHPATIPAVLNRYGFTRIDVIDRQLPRYVAHACREAQRLEISMNRFGEIVNEQGIGHCQPPLNARDLEDKLRHAGYGAVRIVKENANWFVAEVCEDGARYQLELTRYGETVSEKRIAKCPSRRVEHVLDQLEKEGIGGATLYVDGCRKNKRIRIQIDRYGSISGRKVIGRCR